MAYRFGSPPEAYFDRLADAFRHGRLDLVDPPSTHDLTRNEGRWYVPFPPLPALLMLPWVALRGVGGTDTVVFGVLLGAASVSLVFLFLHALGRRGWSKLATADNLWLALLFGFGSVLWTVAPLGDVWYVAQVSALAFIALAAWLAAETGSPWLSGSALALAAAARPHVALSWLLLLGIAAQRLSSPAAGLDRRRLLAWAGASLLPIALVGAGLGAYNLARFENPLEFGYRAENVAAELRSTLEAHGPFSLAHIPRNLWAMWLALPRWNARRGELMPDPWGMSLLLTTPALAYLARAGAGSHLARGAWAALLLLLVPLATYYNTGWWQFGYRFSLDFMVPALALLAVGAPGRLSVLFRVLVLAGVAVNAWGVAWWSRWWFRS